MRHSLGIVSRLPAKILNTVSRNCIPVMPFDILISLFPDNPLVIEVLPQYLGYCWRETGFSVSYITGVAGRTFVIPLFPNRGCHHWIVQPLAVLLGGGGTAKGKFLLTVIQT